MRTIKELLIILRDNTNKKTLKNMGLCYISRYLYVITEVITFNESEKLRIFITKHRPESGSKFYRRSMQYNAYYFKVGALKPRLDWLDYLIKNESNLQKPN